jgi:hypothetical protein
MAISEVQISMASFLTAQLRQLQAAKICLPSYGPEPFSIQVQTITFGQNSIRHNVSADFPVFYADSRINPDPPYLTPTPVPAIGFKTQVAQPITISLSLTADIMAHPNEAAPIIYEVPLTLVFTLDYYPAPMGGCVINEYFDSVEWGPLSALPSTLTALGVDVDDIKATVRDFLAQKFSSRAKPFNFADLLPSGVTEIANAGISVDADLQRIAFRADPAPGNTRNDIRWTNFYRGEITDHVQGADWAIFLEDKVLESFATAQLDEAVRTSSHPGLRISSIGSEYGINAGVPRITTVLHAFFDLPLAGEIYQPLPIYSDLSLDANDGRIIIDVFMTDIPRLINEIKDAVERARYIPIGGLLVDLLAPDDLTIPLPRPDDIPGFKVTRVSDDHYRFEKLIDSPDLGAASMRLRNMVALPNGVAVTGWIFDRPFLASNLKVDISNFGWNGPSFSCGQASKALLDKDPKHLASLYAEISLEGTGTSPIYFCGVEVLNKGNHPFPTKEPGLAVDRMLVPCKIRINMGAPPESYFDAPYDLELLVKTTAGIRYIRIPPPARMTDADARLIKSLIRAQLDACTIGVDGWFGNDGRFDVASIANPLLDPPMEVVDQHFWNFQVQGLAEGQTAALLDKDRGSYVHAAAQPGTPLSLSLIAAPHQTIALLRDVSTADLGTTDVRSLGRMPSVVAKNTRTGLPTRLQLTTNSCGIEVRQQPLIKTAAIHLRSACSAVIPTPMFRKFGIAVVLRDEIAAYDLSNPYRPQRVGLCRVPGVTGVTPWRYGLLAFGTEGFSSLSGDLTRTLLAPCLEPCPIVDLAVGPEVIYVLTDTTLETRSTKLLVMSRLPLDGGKSLFLGRSHLFVADGDSISAFEVSARAIVRRSATIRYPNIFRIVPSLGASGCSLVAVSSDGSSQELTLSNDEFQATAVYSSLPWFAGSIVIGGCLIRISEDRLRLIVSTLGKSRLVVPFETQGSGTMKS